jgi:transposase
MQNYAAKIEWLAIREAALERLAKGYSYTMLHTKFVKEGKVTMAYKTFYKYARAAKENGENASQKKIGTPPRKLGVSKSDSLIKHDSNPDLNDYI